MVAQTAGQAGSTAFDPTCDLERRVVVVIHHAEADLASLTRAIQALVAARSVPRRHSWRR